MRGKHTLILAVPSAEGWKPMGGMIDLKDGVAGTTNVIDERVPLWIEALGAALLELRARQSILVARALPPMVEACLTGCVCEGCGGSEFHQPQGCSAVIECNRCGKQREGGAVVA